MAASYTYTVYLIDVGLSMQAPLVVSTDEDDAGQSVSSSKTKLDYALEFVKTKIAQRLINPKKTDQVAVVLFGGRTRNTLDSENKDGYEHIEEYIKMEAPTYQTMASLDRIQTGENSVDLVAAIYVAGNVVRTCKVARKDATKVVVLLTDADEASLQDEAGNEAIITPWEDEGWIEPLYEAVVPAHNGIEVDYKKLFKLGIIGMDFGRADVFPQDDSSWSPQKKLNVAALQKLTDDINELCKPGPPRAILGDVLSAIDGASAPSINPVKTVTKVLQLSIGDVDEHPDESIQFQVEIQKAVQKASGKSMQKMRKGAWDKSLESTAKAVAGKKRRRDEDAEEGAEEDEDEQDRQALHEPGALTVQKMYYYQAKYDREEGRKANRAEGDAGSDDDEDEDNEQERAQKAEAARRLEDTENLSRAYKYGADLLPVSKEEEEGMAFPGGAAGIQVRGFMKAQEFRPEWALNDPFWLFGGNDNRSQLLFSGLLWALKEDKRHALVRLLRPGTSEVPRLCILIPCVGEDAVAPGLEVGLLIQMPFKEELATWSFPSLDRILTTSGRAVTEHRLLPKPKLLDTMDDFVDSMILPVYADDAGEEDQKMNGDASTSTTPWFDPTASFNPAIHNVRNCLIHKTLHPGDTIDSNSEVSPYITRFLFPPDEVMESSASTASKLLEVSNLSLIPPKPKIARGQGARKKQAARPTTSALDDILGESASAGDGDGQASQYDMSIHQQSQGQRLYRPRVSQAQSQYTNKQSQIQSQSQAVSQSKPPSPKRPPFASKKVKPAKDGDDSATEGSDTEDDAMQVDGNGDDSKRAQDKNSLISWDNPIHDYEELVKQPGLISRANEQMLAIIPRFVAAAESKADLQKAVDCIRKARQVSNEEDEIDVFHSFMYDFRDALKKPKAKHPDFMKRLKQEGLGLITEEENINEGAVGIASEEEAKDFWKG